MKTNNQTTRMHYSIGEHIEEMYGYYTRLSHETCPVCKDEYLTFLDDDPGSVEAAVGILRPCDHPTCIEITSGAVFCGSDLDKLLRLTDRELNDLTQENGTDIIECDHQEINIMDILYRRDEAAGELYTMVNDWGWDMGVEEEDEHVDLEKEKWDNYWGDYNQCGIHISR